jgi:phosphate transport system substrate-binding protein
MNKTLRSLAAAALAVAGLLAVISLPAGAAAKLKPTTCYGLSPTTDKVVVKHVAPRKAGKREIAGRCASGYSTHRPDLQGTNNPGDTDLVVPGAVELQINGSSFDAPLVGATTSGSTAYSAGGKVTFSSYAAAGSGTGRTAITANPPTVNIGFSDQPMTPTAGTLPTGVTESNYAQIPYLLGGAVVGYNLGAGFNNNVKLTAAEIAAIYNGTITTWSNSQIVATNGGATSTVGKALTNLGTNNESRNTIKVFYRSASSGTTYAFTDFLNKAGNSGITASGNVMEGTGNKWGATNIGASANNAAMAQNIVNTLGAIGYVEYSYVLIPGNDAIQVAELQDKNGQWLEPTLANISAAATAAGSSITPDNFSIVDEAGNNVWPLATYSWAIVAKSQPSEATGEAVVKYLDWETHYAQVADATGEGYVPLPATVQAYARAQLETVTYSGTVLLNQKS